MSGTTGDGEPGAGIRASDAERDATVERLSAASGEGRLTLDEFSQRMDRATSARTRAELDALVADLPAPSPAAGTAVAAAAPGGTSWHVSPVGGLRVYGPWRMERQVVVISIVGGTRLDLGQAELAAPEVTLTKVSLVGGVRVRVPAGIRVEVSGFSLVGGTRVQGAPEPGAGCADRPYPRVLAGGRGPGEPGRTRTRRAAGGPAGRAAIGRAVERRSDRYERRSDRYERRYERRARRDRISGP